MDCSDLDLSAIDQRVLGALLEKQRTVPASYPLSLNGLKAACNQQNSREPVTDYDDVELTECLKSLKDRELVRFVWAGKGSRAVKYHQLLEDVLDVDAAQLALLAVLLLRGPQAAGQLKTRTERLHAFADRHEVEAVLTQLADLSLAVELDRRPGQQDARWVHTLGVVDGGDATAAAEPRPDLDTVLADGAHARDERVKAAYRAVATDYHEQFSGELDHQLFDAWLLGRLRERGGDGPLLDVGCGTGHLTAFLAEKGAAVTGVDLSPAMIEVARRRYPGLDVQQGTVLNLLKPRAAAGWAGITCWYGLVHLAQSELVTAFTSMTRVLAPGGFVAMATHVGSEVRHLDQWLGHAVDVDVVLHDADAVGAAAARAGLRVTEWYLRGSHDGEAETERFYLVAEKAA